MPIKKRKSHLAVLTVLLLLQASGLAQQTGNQKTTSNQRGAITGRVLNSAGEPVAGATVYANSFAGTRSQNATAASNGDFKIEGLEPGLYRVFATMIGYVSTPTGGDPSSFFRTGDSVNLTMQKGGVITGTVTGPNGPLVGIGVFAIRLRDEQGKKIPAPITMRERQTDDRGMFRMYALPPGTYIVLAAKPRIGPVTPSAYDLDTPTYYPSATRDIAAEIVVQDGVEITADIQYRAEPGHAISGRVAGVTQLQSQFLPSASITLTDVNTRTAITNTGTNVSENHTFAIFGVPDGEYEVTASQFLQSREELRSPPRRLTVRGTDVTGLELTLAPLATLEGRLVFESDPKMECARRKDTAAQETIVFARRYEPAKPPAPSEVPITATNLVGSNVGDAKGTFVIRNLFPGLYRIDPRPASIGWYIKSLAISSASRTAGLAPVKEAITVKRGERLTGLVVTFAEGAARLRGRVAAPEGQTLPARVVIYLVPAEREAVENLLRFYETNADSNQTFSLDYINPGRYFILARASDPESTESKSIRQDSNLRHAVIQEATAMKKEISFKPCERTADYELPYSPTSPEK